MAQEAEEASCHGTKWVVAVEAEAVETSWDSIVEVARPLEEALEYTELLNP